MYITNFGIVVSKFAAMQFNCMYMFIIIMIFVPWCVSVVQQEMSRRQRKCNNQDDDGMSTAGKVALGVAAAAAGAAIGYFGSRLLSSWLSEPDEEKPKKCDASKSDDSKCDEPKLPSKKDAETKGDNCHTQDSAATQRDANSSMQTTAMHQHSLHEHLLQYYHEYVDIPRDHTQAVQTVIDQLTLAVRSHLHQSNRIRGLGLKIGDLVIFGSATEGHQVIRPNCVDVMIPIMFGSECHAEEGVGIFPGSSVIVVSGDSTCREMCDEEQRLVTRKLLDVLQVAIDKAIEGITGSEYQCAMEKPLSSDSATAISLTVYTAGLDQLTVSFVPFVIIDGHLFLPVHFTEQPDTVGRLWKESFIRQEKWSIDRFDSSVCGHVVVLKILKAIRLNHREQFGAVSSYHLKVVLFHVLEDLPDSGDWVMNAVGERLIDLLTKLTEVLTERHLPHYFEQNVNLLHHVPPETCNNLARFIEKKLAHNDIASLLKRDY